MMYRTAYLISLVLNRLSMIRAMEEKQRRDRKKKKIAKGKNEKAKQ